MPPPSPSKIKIEILRVEGLDNSILSSTSQPYLIAKIGPREFGRSRIIASGTTAFDVTAEPMPWSHEMVVQDQRSIPIQIDLWHDRGDKKPARLMRISEQIRFPWTSGEVTLGTMRKVVCRVLTDRLIMFQGVLARRVSSPGGMSITLRINPALVVDIINIRGLYEPVPQGGYHSRQRSGYISEDNLGRVFVNRDLTGNWKKDYQAIELTAKVTRRAMLVMPSDMKIKWTIIDPDDPANDSPNCHREWGPYIDPNDYDTAGTPTGAKEGDNLHTYQSTGAVALSKIYDKLPPWEAVTGFILSDKTNTSAKTTVDVASGESKVLLHCPNVGGANFVVRAEIETAATPTPKKFPAQTGVITMWKRIDVEVVRMDGAFSLANLVRNIHTYYEPACVQMDFRPEKTLLAGTDSPDNMAPNNIGNIVSTRSDAWINRVFTNKSHAGWFFLGAAKRAHPPPTSSAAPPLFDSNDSGKSYTFGGRDRNMAQKIGWEYVDVNQVLPANSAKAVQFEWIHSGRTVRMHFGIGKQEAVPPPGTGTRLHYVGHDIQSRFTGHDADGNLKQAYQARMWFLTKNGYDSLSNGWMGNGYNTPASARLIVLPKKPGETAGVSPPIVRSTKKYFAGRTIVFTHHPAYANHSTSPPTQRGYFASEMPTAITHEFAHAFGMPHKCGHWDYKAPREHSCCMNYWYHWLLKPGHIDKLSPLTDRKEKPDLCGRHIMEIRRVHMEKNKGLRWS